MVDATLTDTPTAHVSATLSAAYPDADGELTRPDGACDGRTVGYRTGTMKEKYERRLEALEDELLEDSDGTGEELTVSVATETDDAVADLHELRDAADEARVAVYKLNNALAQIEHGRETTAEMMD